MTNHTRREHLANGPLTKMADNYLKRRKRETKPVIEFNPEFVPEYSKRDKWRWVENASDGLRFIGKAHEIRGSGNGNVPYFNRALVDNTGWFTDEFHDMETVCGVVYQLPSRNGKNQYVYGVNDPNNDDCAILDFNSLTDDLQDAVRWSDSMAERYAEAEREYSIKHNAEQRIDDIKVELTEKRTELKALVTDLKALPCGELKVLPAIRAALRVAVAAMRADMRELRKERKELIDNPYAPVEKYWRAR